MIRINLLPIRASKKKAAGKQQLAFFAVSVALALACNFWWSRSRAQEVASREDKLKRTRAEIAQLEKIIGEVKNIKDQQAAVKDKLAVLEKLKAGRQGPVKMLDELATIIPKRVSLRKLEERGGAATLEGSAGTIEDVSVFLVALKHAQYFSAPELKKTAAKQAGRLKAVDFTITATINYTPSVQVATAAAAATPGGKAR